MSILLLTWKTLLTAKVIVIFNDSVSTTESQLQLP